MGGEYVGYVVVQKEAGAHADAGGRKCAAVDPQLCEIANLSGFSFQRWNHLLSQSICVANANVILHGRYVTALPKTPGVGRRAVRAASPSGHRQSLSAKIVAQAHAPHARLGDIARNEAGRGLDVSRQIVV